MPSRLSFFLFASMVSFFLPLFSGECSSLQITIISDTEQQVSLKTTYPFSLYAGNISETISIEKKLDLKIKKGGYLTETEKSKTLEITQKTGNCDLIIISSYNRDHPPFGKSGVVKSADKTQRVIFISSNDPAQTEKILIHETLHALFNLRDEYGGDDLIEVKDYNIKGAFNLTLDKNGTKWTGIREATGDTGIGLYEGGLGANRGVYRGYPDCIMRDLDAKICPICFYYVISELNRLTGTNILYIEQYKNYYKKN